jgi:hypothetical protein
VTSPVGVNALHFLLDGVGVLNPTNLSNSAMSYRADAYRLGKRGFFRAAPGGKGYLGGNSCLSLATRWSIMLSGC